MINKHLLQTVLAGNLLMVLSGISKAWTFINYDRIDINDVSIPITIALITGEIFGSIIFTLLAEFIGRKHSLLAISTPSIIAFFIYEFFYRSKTILCIARTLSGLTVGGTFAVLPVYLVEISETKNRGKLISFAFTSYIAGTFVVNGIFRFIIYGPTLLNLAGILISLIFVIAFALEAPESPYYSSKIGYHDISRRTLEKLSGLTVDNEIALRNIQGQVEQEEQNIYVNERVMPCLNLPGWVKSVIIVLAITISEALLFTGNTSTNRFLYRLEVLTQTVTVVLGLSPVLTSCVCSIFVDVVGRKLLLILTYGLCAASLTIVLIAELIIHDIPTGFTLYVLAVITAVYIISAQGGIMQIRFILISELFAPNKKMITSGVFTALFFGVNLTASIGLNYVGQNLISTLCILFAAISMPIFIKIFFIETNGKSLDQIQMMLNNK